MQFISLSNWGLLSHADTANHSIINIVSRSKGQWSIFFHISSTAGEEMEAQLKQDTSNASDISLSFSTAESHICTCIKPHTAVALLLAWDIWKVSSTGDRIPHPASTQSECTQPQSPTSPSISSATCPWQPRHSTLGIRMRCLSTSYRTSSAAAAQNRYLHLPYIPPPLFTQMSRTAASFPGLGSRRFLEDWQIDIKMKIPLRAALNEDMDFTC